MPGPGMKNLMGKKIFFLFLFIVILIGCGQNQHNKDKKEKPQVTVSILPQKYFVKRITGDLLSIHVMIPPGYSPHTYEPTPKQIKALTHSSIYFRIGYIPFENVWMDNILSANKQLQIVDTSMGVDLIKHTRTHTHHHDHRGIDPHIWLSPTAVKVQSKNILNALIKLDPANRATYMENYSEFINDIDLLIKETVAILSGLSGKKLMVYHPAWGYFARDYGLIQLPIEVDGKNPNPSEMKKIIDTAKREGIRFIFVQKQSDTRSAEAIASEIKGEVIQIDPLALNWLDNMNKIAFTFKKMLQ